MGFMNDDAEDRTIGLPRHFQKASEPPMPPERKKEPAPPTRPARDEKQSPRARVDRSPVRPQAPARPTVQDDVEGTILPPPRPGSRPAPAPPRRPEPEPDLDAMPASPPPSSATNWPVGGGHLPQGPFDPGWAQAPMVDDYGTALPPPQGVAPAFKDEPRPISSEFAPRPWNSPAREAPRPAVPPKSERIGVPARPSRRPIQHRDEIQTMGIGNGQELQPCQKLLMVQFSNCFSPEDARWAYLEQLKEEGLVLGRDSFRLASTEVEFLARDHLRIVLEGDRVFAEEGTSLNGVYLKVPAGRPIELRAGTRFMIGEYVIDFELPDPPRLDEKAISRDRESLRCRRMVPLAYLVFAEPDGGTGVRFPLTHVDGTVLGREGDILLTGAWPSRSHARVFKEGDRFFLEDLGSKNGTFVRIVGRSPIKLGSSRDSVAGDELLIGKVLVRVIEM
jgi:pSer/pThr/pTyr-binding forkhead associated (FHA) protein